MVLQSDPRSRPPPWAARRSHGSIPRGRVRNPFSLSPVFLARRETNRRDQKCVEENVLAATRSAKGTKKMCHIYGPRHLLLILFAFTAQVFLIHFPTRKQAWQD